MKTNRKRNEEESDSGEDTQRGKQGDGEREDKQIEQNSERHRDRVGKREVQQRETSGDMEKW